MRDERQEIRRLHEAASEEARVVFKKVLQLEKDRLFEQRPRLVDDVVRIIKEAAQ